MKRRFLDALARHFPVDIDTEVAAAAALERAIPAVEDLRVTAIDKPAFREGAEAMREEILRVLRGRFSCSCHPAFHHLGVHAPGHREEATR